MKSQGRVREDLPEQGFVGLVWKPLLSRFLLVVIVRYVNIVLKGRREQREYSTVDGGNLAPVYEGHVCCDLALPF